MRPVLAIVALVSISAGWARADDISVYADQAGTVCALSVLQPFPANNSAYIVHKFNAGSTASQFKVGDTSGLIPSTQTTPYLALGTWNTDLSLAYGGCVVGDHVLMTLNFYWLGTQFHCENQLVTLPAPTSPIPGTIAIVDCATPSGNFEPASGGQMFFGPEGITCNPSRCSVNATESRTWGGVKALYR